MSRAGHATLVCSLIAIGAAIRCWHLGGNELWLDEVYSWAFAVQPAGAILGQVSYIETNPPLYYLILHAAIGVFGAGEWAMRAPTALASSATIWVVYLLGRRLASRAAGLYAAAMFAVTAVSAFYAQEARAYAIVGLFDALAVLGLAYAIRRPVAARPGRHAASGGWVLFTLAAIASVYSHYTSAFFVLACGLATAGWAAWHRDRRLFRGLLLSGLVIAAGSSWAIYLMWILSHSSLIAWIRQPTWQEALGQAIGLYGMPYVYALQPIITYAFVGLALCAVVLSRPMAAFPASLLLLFLGVLYGVGAFGTAVFNFRSIVPPGFIIPLLFGCSVAAIGWRPARLAILGGFLLLGLYSCWNAAQIRHSSDRYREVAQAIAQQIRPGEVAVAGPGIAYYRQRLGLDFALLVWMRGFDALDIPGAAMIDDVARDPARKGYASMLLVTDPFEEAGLLSRFPAASLVFQAGRDKVFRIPLVPSG